MTSALQAVLAAASVDPQVFTLRPDYRALLVAVEGIVPGADDGAGDEATEALLRSAEDSARMLLADQAVEQVPHVAAWREAYRAFGAKPQRTRNSLEALLRRAAAGLPRVNRLTDVYNAVSVLHRIPIGGEDIARYAGPPRLLRATGGESFVTVDSGAELTEPPEVGEVVWCDDAGVTCRRWNWRQTRRTQLSDTTTSALFILDALAPCTDRALDAAATALLTQLARLGPQLSTARRLLTGAANSSVFR